MSNRLGGSVSALLWPRVLGQYNRWQRGSKAERSMVALFVLLGAAFWIGIFALFAWMVGSFHQVEVFGPILSRKLFELLMLGLFGLLCFSNVLTGLSTFFLSDDLELVLSLPIERETFFYARFTDTIAQTSWMMLVFGLPIFAAYAHAYDASGLFAALLVLVVPAFVVIPAAIGVAVASIMVNVFPAQRVREGLVFLGVGSLVFVFVTLRLVRPERLMNAESFESVAAYVAELQTPVPLLAPPGWASDVLIASLMGRPLPWIELGLLVSGAVAATGLARWLTEAVYDSGRAKSQVARAARMARAGWFDLFLAVWARPLPPVARHIMVKDMKSFFRDPSQWSQIFLVGSIVVISLASVAALPMDIFRGPWMKASRDGIAFMMFGLVGFVMAAVSGRFQFTAVSTEARAFWIVRSGPVTAAEFLWAKMWPSILPMIVVGEVLAVSAMTIVGAGPFMVGLAALTALCLAFGISGLSVGLGAIYPDFKADNAARVAAGPSGVLFMVCASTLVLAVIGLEVFPVYTVLASELRGAALGPKEWAQVIGPLVCMVGLCCASAVIPVRLGARHLWSRELPNG